MISAALPKRERAPSVLPFSPTGLLGSQYHRTGMLGMVTVREEDEPMGDGQLNLESSPRVFFHAFPNPSTLFFCFWAA